jgi:hypothetical protein
MPCVSERGNSGMFVTLAVAYSFSRTRSMDASEPSNARQRNRHQLVRGREGARGRPAPSAGWAWTWCWSRPPIDQRSFGAPQRMAAVCRTVQTNRLHPGPSVREYCHVERWVTPTLGSARGNCSGFRCAVVIQSVIESRVCLVIPKLDRRGARDATSANDVLRPHVTLGVECLTRALSWLVYNTT